MLGGIEMNVISYDVFNQEACEEVLDLWRNTEGVCLHENGEDTVEGIANYLDRNPGFSFIAKYNEKIIGALLCGHDGRRGFIHHLAVDKHFQKMNIGKTLIDMSLNQLRMANIHKTALFVLKENGKAKEFYKHLNWNEEKIVEVFTTIL